MTSSNTQETASASNRAIPFPAEPETWGILPTNVLVAAMENMPTEERRRSLAHAGLPRPSVGCRRCAKAHWKIVDRELVCYCKNSAEITWLGGDAIPETETTLCDELILQAMEAMERGPAMAQAPAREETPERSQAPSSRHKETSNALGG